MTENERLRATVKRLRAELDDERTGRYMAEEERDRLRKGLLLAHQVVEELSEALGHERTR